MRHPIPREALDDRLGFIGTSGSGKTYNAGTAIEILLSNKSRVVIIDPLGVWWGLRLRADGKQPSAFDVAIFGGPHGDLPLTENAGALIGETAISMTESCIIDLSELKTRSAERRFMVAFLETIYRKASGDPFHLIVDEADLFAPQKPQKGDEVLLGHMENIVRRGRVKGFIPWIISQRPAVVNKNVLSQVDGLLAFKLTSVQDRDALDSWIEGQADKAQGKEIKASLPALEIGKGVVWLPGHQILRTADFPKKVTFDSSRRLKRGEKSKARSLKPLNLAALKERLAAVEKEAKADNPKALRADIAKLQAEKAQLERQIAAAQNAAPKTDPDAIRKAEQRGFEQAKKKLESASQRELIKAKRDALTTIAAGLKKFANEIAQSLKNLDGTDALFAIEFVPTENPQWTPAQIAQMQREGRPPLAPNKIPPLRVAAPHAKPAVPSGDTDRPLGAERKPLSALAAVHPAGMTEAQWAVAAGLKRKGGTWSTYLSRLRQAGRIEKQGDLYLATAQGIADLGGNIEALPPPGPQLVQFWIGKINGVGPMLNRLAELYPSWTTRAQLAADLDLAASGGTFSTYLSRLRTPGLIEVSGDQVRAAPQLMGSP